MSAEPEAVSIESFFFSFYLHKSGNYINIFKYSKNDSV